MIRFIALMLGVIAWGLAPRREPQLPAHILVTRAPHIGVQYAAAMGRALGQSRRIAQEDRERAAEQADRDYRAYLAKSKLKMEREYPI